MYQTLKCMQSHQYGKIKRLYRKPVFWVFFSMLGTKTIYIIWKSLNMGIHKKKKKTEKVSFQCFTKRNVKTDANQRIWRNRITLPKRYILSVFELLTFKKGEYGWKALYIKIQKDITRNVYNERFWAS